MSDWQQRFINEVRARYGEPLPPLVAEYLDAFERESAPNHDARERVWAALPSAERWRLNDIQRDVNPQLFS